MKDILTVFRFTLREGIRKKVFIIVTIIVLALIVVACSIPALTSGDSGTDVTGEAGGAAAVAEKTSTCYFIDDANLVPGAKEALSAAYPAVEFVDSSSDEIESDKTVIENDTSFSAIEIVEGETMPSLNFYTTNIMSGLDSDGMAKIVRQVYVYTALGEAGVSASVTQLALTDISYETVLVGKMDISGYALGILLTIIIFFAVYYYGYGVAMSVASEKTSRVMETLIVSCKPSRILLGKCLGMGVLGLLQLTLFLIVGAAGYTLLVPADFTISGIPLALSSFTVSSALLVLAYFILGYALYAMINSVCGATVSRTEDLNSAMMPAVLISIISFYAAYMVMFMPDSGMKRVVTYIPFTSPFIMPFRLLNETVPMGDILISILLLLVAIILVAIVSVRIYSVSVLHYGGRLKIRNLLKSKG